MMKSILPVPKMKFYKTNADAQLPVKNHKDDAGWDLISVEEKIIPAKDKAVVDVGLKLAYLEPGYWIRVSSRSGMSFKNGILAHPGVVDNGYRGSLGVLLYNHSNDDYKVNKGDRVAQIVLHFNIEMDVDWGDIESTERGDKGFGSSGR
jgi:dUTP pyrophosphatase